MSAFDILLTTYVLTCSCSIVDEHELDRILESVNLDEYELIDFPMEQLGDSSHEHIRAPEWRSLIGYG